MTPTMMHARLDLFEVLEDLEGHLDRLGSELEAGRVEPGTAHAARLALLRAREAVATEAHAEILRAEAEINRGEGQDDDDDEDDDDDTPHSS